MVTATLDVSGGLPKFVDRLPGLGPGGANNVGQYIPVGVPKTCTYSGQTADCYSIALDEYSEKLPSNLPATKLRGYVQLETPGVLAVLLPRRLTSKSVSLLGGQLAIDNPHYLGPSSLPKAE